MLSIKKYDKYLIKDLELLGSGTQGSVYKIDEYKCIKIFKKKTACSDELHSMLIAQIDSHFPLLYDYGDDYIIREYIQGIPLDSYLENHLLIDKLSYKLIELYKAMYFVGFKRLDFALFHVFLILDETDNIIDIKLIDIAKAMKKSYFYPVILMKSLEELKYKDKFLKFIETYYTEIYNKWSIEKHILK